MNYVGVVSCRVPVRVGSGEAAGRVYPCRSLRRSCHHPASRLHFPGETRLPLTPSYFPIRNLSISFFFFFWKFQQHNLRASAFVYTRSNGHLSGWKRPHLHSCSCMVCLGYVFMLHRKNYISVFNLLKIYDIILSKCIYNSRK